MDREDDTPALLCLIAAGGRGAPRRRLLEVHGSARAALAAGRSAWREAGLDAAQQGALSRRGGPVPPCWLRWLAAAPARRVLGWHDRDYPALLREIASPPLALWVAGDPDLLWHPSVAVVGSRAATAGGLRTAHEFSRAFARGGLLVASGLAAGIDTAAHEGALAAPQGRTVAVLGTAIDEPYPSRNAGLYGRIATQGAVVSELPPGTAIGRGAFPSRNRILAGLSLGVLVVEAALRSGAAITARLGADSGREVFAIPGSIHNPKARGCHRLIRDGAALVESADEVARALAPVAAALAERLRGRLETPPAEGPTGDPTGHHEAPADPDRARVWRALGHDPVGMDELAARTGLAVSRVAGVLLLLELDGRVAAAHGRYARAPG